MEGPGSTSPRPPKGIPLALINQPCGEYYSGMALKENSSRQYKTYTRLWHTTSRERMARVRSGTRTGAWGKDARHPQSSSTCISRQWWEYQREQEFRRQRERTWRSGSHGDRCLVLNYQTQAWQRSTTVRQSVVTSVYCSLLMIRQSSATGRNWKQGWRELRRKWHVFRRGHTHKRKKSWCLDRKTAKISECWDAGWDQRRTSN